MLGKEQRGHVRSVNEAVDDGEVRAGVLGGYFGHRGVKEEAHSDDEVIVLCHKAQQFASV